MRSFRERVLINCGISILVIVIVFGWNMIHNMDDAMADNAYVICSMTGGEGYPGEVIEVLINVDENPGTIMSETRFYYDSDVIEVIGIESKDLFKNDHTEGQQSEWIVPNYEKNPVKIIDGYLDVTDNTNHTGELYVIRLKIKDTDYDGDCNLKFEGVFYDWELNEHIVKPVTATISILQDKNRKNNSSTEGMTGSDDLRETDDGMQKRENNEDFDMKNPNVEENDSVQNQNMENSRNRLDSEDEVNERQEMINKNSHKNNNHVAVVGCSFAIIAVILITILLYRKSKYYNSKETNQDEE